jgi:arabinose-5-phosphate isomerase
LIIIYLHFTLGGKILARRRIAADEREISPTHSLTMDVTLAREVMRTEAEAIMTVKDRLGESFTRAVEMILGCRGKVVLVGIGKSGTPAFFLHPVEGVHGELGMLAEGDVVIVLSNSGHSEEVLEILPIIRGLNIPVIALTGNVNSALARQSNVVIDLSVKEEACPMGLVPTSSTATAMAVGDALAVVLYTRRGFRAEDFALVHPGGSLGRRLLLKVCSLMRTGDAIPRVTTDTPMREVIYEMTSKRLGITGVCDPGGNLVGVITDGDLRRGLERHRDLLSLPAHRIMTTNPKWIEEDALAARALHLMEEHAITSLFVYTNGSRDQLTGIIHIHDLLNAGVC